MKKSVIVKVLLVSFGMGFLAVTIPQKAVSSTKPGCTVAYRQECDVYGCRWLPICVYGGNGPACECGDTP